MCNFNKQNPDTKLLISLLMQKSAQTIGGENALLTLVEAMRETKPHPLISEKKQIRSKHAVLSWNKVVFKEKLQIIESILLEHKSSENPDFNILNIPSQKRKKEIINMVKALNVVDFIVKPLALESGGGFEFKVFETVDLDAQIVVLNPLFIALFFCAVDYTKRALKHEA